MKQLLLVEDDENFGSLLMNYLKLSGYHVDWVKNGTEGYSMFMKNRYDLCILDIMMPYMDGFALGKKIASHGDIPFIYLTARNQKEDVIQGYKIGADDYLTKPFDTEVLLLKISAVLARTAANPILPEKQNTYEFGQFIFDAQSRILKNGEERKLSPKESMLLELLCRYKGEIMPREIALKEIWNQNDYFTTRSMDVYIGKLRKYLASDNTIKLETVHQVGFQLIYPITAAPK